MTIAVRSDKAQAIMNQNTNMTALHNGSRVFVRKDDILKIFCDKPALYSVRLAALVFGEETMQQSCMPDETDPKYTPLDEDVLESIISKMIIVSCFDFSNRFSFLPAHVVQVFKQQNKNVSRAIVKNSIRMRLKKSHIRRWTQMRRLFQFSFSVKRTTSRKK